MMSLTFISTIYELFHHFLSIASSFEQFWGVFRHFLGVFRLFESPVNHTTMLIGSNVKRRPSRISRPFINNLCLEPIIMPPVSLDCPFLIAPLGFSNVSQFCSHRPSSFMSRYEADLGVSVVYILYFRLNWGNVINSHQIVLFSKRTPST